MTLATLSWTCLLAAGLLEPASTDPPTLFVQANTAYAEGEYARATELYEQLVHSGVDNGYVWYNLGNAYLRAGDLGAAVAAYLRSQSLLPRDADVRANLAFARQSTKDDIAYPTAAVARTLFFWHYSLNRLELCQGVACINLLFWMLLAWRLYRRDSEILRWATTGVLLVVVAMGASLTVRMIWPTRVVVMQNAEIDVHSGTSRDTVVQFKLHAGSEGQWLETRGAWLRVGLPDSKQGWVHQEDVVALVL